MDFYSRVALKERQNKITALAILRQVGETPGIGHMEILRSTGLSNGALEYLLGFLSFFEPFFSFNDHLY